MVNFKQQSLSEHQRAQYYAQRMHNVPQQTYSQTHLLPADHEVVSSSAGVSPESHPLPSRRQVPLTAASSSNNEAGPSGQRRNSKNNGKKSKKTKKTAPQGGVQKQNGRKKIKIEYMQDNRARQVSFLKRKNGVLKKAYELSVLTGCETAVVIFSNDNKKLYEFMSATGEGTLEKYSKYAGVSERRLCLTVGDEGFTGVRKSKNASPAQAPSSAKGETKGKSSVTSKTLKLPKMIAKGKQGAGSLSRNTVEAATSKGASADPISRRHKTQVPTDQREGGECNRAVSVQDILKGHEAAHPYPVFQQAGSTHIPEVMETVESSSLTPQTPLTAPTQWWIPGEELLDIGAPLSATDNELIEFMEAEIAIDSEHATNSVTQAMEEFDNADKLFPTGAVHGPPLVFPDLSENMAGLGRFEHHLHEAPFVSPITSGSGSVEVPDLALPELPSLGGQAEPDVNFPPEYYSRFSHS